jgi:hypothetical protein
MQSKKLRPGLCPMKPVRTCNRNCAHPMTSYCKPHPKPVKKYYIDLMDSELVRAHRCGPLKLSLSGPSTPAVALAAGISTAIPATATTLSTGSARGCRSACRERQKESCSSRNKTDHSCLFAPLTGGCTTFASVASWQGGTRQRRYRIFVGWRDSWYFPHCEQYMRGRSSISRPNAFLLSNQVSPIYNLPMFLSFYTLPYLSISMPGHLVYLPISLPLSLSVCLSSMSMFHACIWKNVSQNMARN